MLLEVFLRGPVILNIYISGAGIAQLVERQTEKPGAILTRVQVPGVVIRHFSSRVNIQCRLSHGVRTAPVCNGMHQQLCAR